MANTIQPDPWQHVSISLRHCNLFVCRPDWRIDPQQVHYHNFFYITKGAGWLEYASQRMEAKTGDLFIAKYGDTCAAGHDPKNPISVYSVGYNLHTPVGHDPIQQAKLPLRLRMSVAHRKAIKTIFGELVKAYKRQDYAGSIAVRGKLLELIARVSDLCQTANDKQTIARPTNTVTKDSRIVEAQRYIDTHLDEPCTVARLARHCGLSPSHFSHLFQKTIGLTPMEFLRRRRVDHAKLMLAESDYSVSEVAEQVGYADPFHFSRVFSKLEGMSPSAYRESWKNPFGS